ncbi:Ribonuclease D [hydrothermal vent metagenome]|uniref:Ribonuclease D n=1 Tax=hydrothermal vent metagenome TaxID=652676 RepID=A0A3B0UQ95_9ZZZZ
MQLLTKTSELAQFCRETKEFDFVTIDTEFHRETTYWPILCLIQAATSERAVLIDPMAADIDLTPFFELLDDPEIVKVFHAARQDIEIFVHMTGKVPQSIFDTQVAASVCGHGDQISYDNLVHSIVGQRLDKSSRFTDWAARPLSDKQKKYALGDVTHLRDVYLALCNKLKQLDRVDWMKDESEILERVATYIVQPEDAWKRLKHKLSRARDLATLKLLAQWRETRAQKMDKPRGRILKDDAIYELAVQRPKTAGEFERLRAVPKGFGRSQSASEIIDLIKQAENIPEADLPALPNRKRGPSPKGPVGDLLRVLLKAVSEREGVAARIIANSDDIDALVLDDSAEIAALRGWRFKLFGEKALAIKHGEIGLAATKDGIVEFNLSS